MKGEAGMPNANDGVPSGVEQCSIVWLPDALGALDTEVRRTFFDLFDVDVTVGELVLPEHMRAWVERYFGSADAVTRQRIVKVTNRWTLDATLFNELRARRPLEARIPAELADELARTAPDPFCEPEYNTPEDVFGRIRGRYVITASNIAKYDGLHGVIVFREHDPLAFDEGLVREMVAVARAWFDRAHEVDPVAVYPLFMWNCLWKSGASIPHGHAQVSLTRRLHYGKVERERRAAEAYRAQIGRRYFDDLFRVHEHLGLGRTVNGVRVYANLTPLKEKETVLLAPAFADDLAQVMSRVVRCLVDELNVTSFNLVAWIPPLAATPEDWSDVPVVVRVVDRGDPLSRTSDFGAMELYAASVVASDPFRVAEVLWRCLGS
ncbi:MAG: hypothetical protein RMK01_00260 [Thermomicrobium sp.]|nr:hypothetical protein [Thermomicrobium sp.]MDW8058487.1 hypothetical protein [Thermomicrobium sp.]